MNTSIDCTSRAEECRRLAKSAAKPEDWQHFLEMATTWDMLARQRATDKLAETWALWSLSSAIARLAGGTIHTERMAARHFPPPWSVDELDACYIVRDQGVTPEDQKHVCELMCSPRSCKSVPVTCRA